MMYSKHSKRLFMAPKVLQRYVTADPARSCAQLRRRNRMLPAPAHQAPELLTGTSNRHENLKCNPPCTDAQLTCGADVRE